MSWLGRRVAHDCTKRYAGTGDGFGNYVAVKCDDGLGDAFYAAYMHLSHTTTVPTTFVLRSEP
jgi:murein DD-endopeptidase MepM/ murein hydrolase activator NlpD